MLDTPLALAWMVTGFWLVEIPLASPVGSMVAIPALLENQEKTTPLTALLLASKAVAVNCWVPPTEIVAEAGAIVMLATVAVTVSVTGALVTVTVLELELDPEKVVVLAVICVVPMLCPVATPASLMRAIFGALLVQV